MVTKPAAGGFDYIHDVAPDGPVAWVWFDIIRTALSRADDHFEFTKKWTGNNDNCNNFDQALIGDSLVTAGVGRPLYYNHVMACKRPRDNPEEAHFVARNGQRLTTNQVVENMMSLMAYRGRGKFYPGTPNKEWLDQLGWLPEIPAIDAEMWSVNITIPNMNYGYPEELGEALLASLPD